jgi:hypothetical protein
VAQPGQRTPFRRKAASATSPSATDTDGSPKGEDSQTNELRPDGRERRVLQASVAPELRAATAALWTGSTVDDELAASLTGLSGLLTDQRPLPRR